MGFIGKEGERGDCVWNECPKERGKRGRDGSSQSWTRSAF